MNLPLPAVTSFSDLSVSPPPHRFGDVGADEKMPAACLPAFANDNDDMDVQRQRPVESCRCSPFVILQGCATDIQIHKQAIGACVCVEVPMGCI